MPAALEEYDDLLTMQTIERITVMDAETVKIKFYGLGIELNETLKA